MEPPHSGALTLCARLSRVPPGVRSPQIWSSQTEERRRQPESRQKQEALSEELQPGVHGARAIRGLYPVVAREKCREGVVRGRSANAGPGCTNLTPHYGVVRPNGPRWGQEGDLCPGWGRQCLSAPADGPGDTSNDKYLEKLGIWFLI